MKQFTRAFVAAALLTAGSSGCMRLEQSTTLFPDGSGKLVITIGMNTAKMSEMPGMEEKDPLDDFTDVDKMEKDVEGIVAWAEPVKKIDGDWTYVTMTGYFEDINKVKIWKDEATIGSPDDEEGDDGMNGPPQDEPKAERKLQLAFELKRGTDGSTLVVKDESRKEAGKMDDQVPEGNEEMRAQMLEMMKQMLEGFKATIRFTVPGAVTKAAGLPDVDGRTASISIDDQLMFDAMEGKDDAKKKMESFSGETKISWAKDDVPQAEIDAFKKELAAAKEKWKTLREEWKKKAAERKKHK